VRRAWATALALAWLRSDASGFENEWRMLAQKALHWLERETGGDRVRDAYLDSAMALLGS
jgi:hypothetical protein